YRARGVFRTDTARYKNYSGGGSGCEPARQRASDAAHAAGNQYDASAPKRWRRRRLRNVAVDAPEIADESPASAPRDKRLGVGSGGLANQSARGGVRVLQSGRIQ